MSKLHLKYEKLKDYLKSLGRVAVAYSAGVDSTFLLKTAHNVLGDDAIAITVKHSAFPQRDFSEADDFCKREKIKQIKLQFDVFSVKGFNKNPPDRCYICKKALFQNLIDEAKKQNIENILEGSNADDDKDYRPGKKAILELNIKSPLKEAGLTKEDIRILSKEQGIYTWNKPSYACLATRIPYNDEITKDKLFMIEKAEDYLYNLGFKQSRVRLHKDVARIEIEEAQFEEIITKKIRNDISNKLRELGFTYVSLDLDGYKMGSLNRKIIKD